MNELQIVSYNIYDGVNRENIVTNVFNFAQSGADIFCLQEVRPANGHGFIGDELLSRLGAGWQGEFFLSAGPGNNDNGLAILWRSDKLQSVKFQTLSVPKIGDLARHEKLIEFVNGKSLQPIQRGALVGDFIFQDKKIRITNVHLDWHGRIKHRARQMEQLVGQLKADPFADAEIICGDFNTLGFFGFGQRLKAIESLLLPDYTNLFPKFHYTTTHFQQLDHIFTRNLKTSRAEVLQLAGSDHYPITAKFSF